ncbi:MAG: hypothetical protein J0L86_05555 [Flavobacteriales bacterium]|nr:hypothetical protein [Flavobacteriales bacterium]
MMRITIILMLLICQFIFGQSNNKLSINLDTVIDENISDLTTKHSEYLYNKTTSLFSQEGFEINDTGFPTIIPKLSKISNIESDDIYAKTMIVRLSLDIQVKSNSTTIASYNDELAGSGTTINEATLSAIDKLGGLRGKDKFELFISDVLKRNIEKQNNQQSNKLNNFSEKPAVYYIQNDGETVVTDNKHIENVTVTPEKENWLEKFLNNTNNLFGIIGSIVAFFLFIWGFRMRQKINNKTKRNRRKRNKP